MSYFCISNVIADANFDINTGILSIPYVQYHDEFYQAELQYQSPDKLTLKNIQKRNDSPKAGEIVPVYDDLSFYLSEINVGGKLYRAYMLYQTADKTFKVTHLASTANASSGDNNFISDYFSGSGNCSICHDGLKDENQKVVSIVRAWQPTMMANASRDPFWKAKVRTELNRTPNLSAVINDKCSRCHAPMANETAKKQGSSFQLFGDNGLLNAEHSEHNLAMEGISCTLCHQIKNTTELGTSQGISGKFKIDSFANSSERRLYGPYQNILTQPMINMVSFTPEYSPHIKESKFCASCHDLKTPYTDNEGNILSTDAASEFPEQMPYAEWLHSDFVNQKSCQQCHMQRANGVVIASRPRTLKTKRDDFAQHSFVGANKLILTIFQDYKESLGVLAEDFSETLANTDTLLKSASELSLVLQTHQQDSLDFTLHIANAGGHKLPTSYPSRRVIVHVSITDNQGKLVFESGKVNSNGSVVGLDSDNNGSRYEPHYEKINNSEQVQVYETIMEDYQQAVTYTLLRAKQYRKDNRLLPQGFDKTTAVADIQVKGLAAFDTNFIGGSDEISYQIAGLNDDNYQVKVELIYQTLAYAFAQDMFRDNSAEVNQFRQMFTASSMKSIVIKELSFTSRR